MRIGVVGCGLVAEYHMPFIVKQKSVDRVTVTDHDAEKANQLAKRFGVEAVSNFQTMLRNQRPDVIHVLTPPKSHAQLAIEAIGAGCHVFVEKPMALTVAETDAMNRAVRRHQIKLCVGHSRLCAPVMLIARNFVEDGKIGELLHVDVSYHFDITTIVPAGTKSDEKIAWIQSLPGGVLFDLMPHPVSIMLQFIKEPLHICATGRNNGIHSRSGLDEIRAFFAGTDVTGFLSVSLGTKPDGLTVHLYGTKMSIHVNLPNMTIITCKKRHVPRAVSRALENVEYAAQLLSCTFINGFKFAVGMMPPPDGIASIIGRFYTSIETNTEPPVTGDDGSAVLRVSTEILDRAIRAENHISQLRRAAQK
jgi:predicted dehydrogenase